MGGGIKALGSTLRTEKARESQRRRRVGGIWGREGMSEG